MLRIIRINIYCLNQIDNDISYNYTIKHILNSYNPRIRKYEEYRKYESLENLKNVLSKFEKTCAK